MTWLTVLFLVWPVQAIEPTQWTICQGREHAACRTYQSSGKILSETHRGAAVRTLDAKYRIQIQSAYFGFKKSFEDSRFMSSLCPVPITVSEERHLKFVACESQMSKTQLDSWHKLHRLLSAEI
jgi:hypothetical protein